MLLFSGTFKNSKVNLVLHIVWLISHLWVLEYPELTLLWVSLVFIEYLTLSVKWSSFISNYLGLKRERERERESSAVSIVYCCGSGPGVGSQHLLQVAHILMLIQIQGSNHFSQLPGHLPSSAPYHIQTHMHVHNSVNDFKLFSLLNMIP